MVIRSSISSHQTLSVPGHLLRFIPVLNHWRSSIYARLSSNWGGVQPHFCPWKNVCFPIFSHGEKWEKSIWKEREMNTFASLSIHFFSIFPHWEKWGKKSIWKEREMNTFPFLAIYFFSIFPMGKNGKTHIFPWAKMGLDPPPQQLQVANDDIYDAFRHCVPKGYQYFAGKYLELKDPMPKKRFIFLQTLNTRRTEASVDAF